ncbi:hypothetical protein NP233_g3579 [Leucocoprinus birnbaumii]|uniref:C2H2-type domain-containing protein n=1 Tax=Leucocoprinus birnbaumii TaxID=56174 RepID=A0AAD5VWX2_9AGAR|nr:hypothetical protein NP233_g3579 [Leucocoprinus birnbaumii]
MSSPPDNNRSDKRVTLPPIRDFFRADEFLHSQSPGHEPPATTLARLRMSDDGSEPPPLRPLSPGQSRLPGRMYRSTSDQLSPPSVHQTSASHLQLQQSPSTSPYQNRFRSAESSSMSTPPSTSRQLETLATQRMTNTLPPLSQPRVPNPSPNQPRDWPMDTTGQHLYPSYRQSSYNADSREPLRRSPAPNRPLSPPNPGSSAQVHSPDSPPALVQAVAPWVIATNLDVGQIYEDDERTPIARPFDAGPMGRSPSHVVSLGRFFDEGSQPPLGKYDCKFCGKLFNRPSSLRIHLNSHTGEKPFICPHPDCGRSFSVLSNMRRHARVHMNNPKEQEPEESNEESISLPSPTDSSLPRASSSITYDAAPMENLTQSWQTQYRTGSSNASPSSSGSRQSRADSFDGGRLEEAQKSEKRSRNRPE